MRNVSNLAAWRGVDITEEAAGDEFTDAKIVGLSCREDHRR
jgi:hypothetical protein